MSVSEVRLDILYSNHHPIVHGINELSDDFDSFIAPIGKWLNDHPNINTIVVLANHIFRGFAMIAMMNLLPYSLLVNSVISLGASLFYRITIERFCQFRFALPAAFGGIAYEISKPSFYALIDFTASKSLETLKNAIIGITPILFYFASIIWISYSSVQNLTLKLAKAKEEEIPSCCCT